MRRWILAAVVVAWSVPALAQTTTDGDRIMTAVRAALAPALPYPDADDTGSPVNASPVPLWVVRPLQPGDRSIETGLWLMHLSVHLGYHLGQIDYHRRTVTGNPAGADAMPLQPLVSV